MSQDQSRKKYRRFPVHTLEEALAVPQKIADERAGKPFKRLLLADALSISPGSSNCRNLLSSSAKYGLTEGTEKASEIKLTDLGRAATQTERASERQNALRRASAVPDPFARFFTDYKDKKLPSPEMLGKILTADYAIPAEHAGECARLIEANGRFAGIVRDIQGSPHVLFDLDLTSETPQAGPSGAGPDARDTAQQKEPQSSESGKITEEIPVTAEAEVTQKLKPIFIGHGRNKQPLEKLQKILTSFQIPYKVTVEEPNLGRPIPQKVKETMQQCGSAILVFTRDERFYDQQGNEVWRPSENVVHELGAASFLYGDRVVIFKETGLSFPTNYQSIGYIEFVIDEIEAKTVDLLKELLGFGLLRFAPA